MSQINTNAILDASGGTTATVNGFTPTVSNMGGKNRIINGDMRIDQRNAGASVTVSGVASPFVLDRWRVWSNGGGGSGASFTVQQSSASPAGFTNSCLITQTGSASPTGSEYNIFAQYIEGNNVSDLGWGTANAKTVTLSFWVRSSLTGTFGGVVSNSSQLRSYPFTYSISVADTWEYKTITIPGDTTGTWLTTNGIGLEIYWQLGVGSSLLGAAGSWAGATYLGATGATQITATNGATLYITGVQLEAGSVATPFEHRQYGQELALCQRYYQLMNWGFAWYIDSGSPASKNQRLPLPIPMRATPTGTVSVTASFNTITGPAYAGVSEREIDFSFSVGGNGNYRQYIAFTNSAEL